MSHNHEAAWVPATALQPVEDLASEIVARGSCIGKATRLTKWGHMVAVALKGGVVSGVIQVQRGAPFCDLPG